MPTPTGGGAARSAGTRGLLEHAVAPGENAWGDAPRFSWEAPGGVDRASSGPEAHVLFPPERLHEACCKGFAEEVDWLLNRADPPSDPNLLDPGGRTPLHFAAGWGRVDIVEMLLARGARLETRDRWRKAPIDWALQAQQDEVVERLRIEAVRRGTRGGRGAVAPLATAVEAATGKTQEEIVEELRAFAAKVFRKYRDEDRP